MKITPELYTKAYTRGIQSALKGLATDGSDLHENYTPPVICDMMLDKLDLTQPKFILILYNLELLFALRLRKYTGPVTFFTQSPTKAEIAPKFLPGVAVEYIDKEENPLYLMETKWPEKFDIVVANPPYSKKLDLKFLDKAFDVAKEEIVFVHPSTMFVERKKAIKMFGELRNKIKDSLLSLTLFNGNGIFGIGLYSPCSITHINKHDTCDTFKFVDEINKSSIDLVKNDIENLSLFGYNKNFISLENKIKPSNNLLSNSKKEPVQNNFIVQTSHIQGASKRGSDLTKSDKLQNPDFYTIIRKWAEPETSENHRYSIVWNFETEREAINFISYCKTDFARMCLALTKINQHIGRGELNFVPWMDFTQEWTDEKLYAHFGITEEEQAFIKEVIPPYYD